MELLLLAVGLGLLVQTSENLQITVQPDEVSTVTLSTTLPLGLCSVCELSDEAGASAACTSSLEIGPRKNVTMQFNCSEPQNAFSVLIRSQIECKKTDCSPAEGNAPASLLSEFNRTFEWKLNAPAETTIVMNFPEGGLKMVAVGADCTDGYSYSVSPLGSVQAQSYCKNGPVSRVELPNQATVSVLVPQQQAMDVNLFTVTPNLIQQKGHARSVTPDPNTVVLINRREEGSDCVVCMGEGASQICGLKLKLDQSETTNVIFNCTKPQDVFNVEIIRVLDCSKGCNYDTINPDWSFFPDFNRTFTWDMKVALNKAFQIDFPAPGMRQIKSSEQCPDKHTYTILMYPRGGPVNLGTFCQNGSISRIQILWRGRMTLEVPRDTTMSSSSFRYSTANGVLAAVVGAVLPRGQSDTDFYSANNIPVGYKMSWNFDIPPKHNFTVKFLEYIKPECQGKQAKVIYEQANKDPVEKALSDDQPSNYQGNFNLTVANCDVVKKNGLLLTFRVSVFRGGLPEMCEVDLRNNQGLSLKIEKKDPNSFCELRMDSVVQEKIIVPSGSKAKLSFLDCFSDELLLTATKTIECQILPCPEVGTPLTIPSLDSCIPTTLQQVVWELRVPEQSAVKLSSSQGNLHQSVPGQESECIMSVLVSETDGSSIGRFCSFGSRGIIQSFQISSNITVTAMADGAKRLSQESGPFITAFFSPEIKEKIIYTISPLISTPAFLMTPNWPRAMKSDSTISWIINVPDEHNAELNFLNVSWPQCDKSHANIAIQESGSENELGFREDAHLVPKHSIPRTFYLNMSNCEPEKDYFAVLSKVSLQKNPGNLLGIILGVVGALLAVLIIAIIAVCVLVKKKKNQTGPRSSMNIPKGVASLPGDVTFPKTRVENDSRVYETIDDTMVYTHLLQQDGYTEKGPGHFNGNQKNTTVKQADDVPDSGRGPEKDTYRPFLASMDTFMPSKPRTALGRLGSMDYEDRRMVDNELYTFKNTGDINTISLSAVEPLPLPEPEPFEAEYDQAM